MEGTPSERACAERLLPIIEKHHWLLVSLLLVNAIANEALPIFLDQLVDSSTAVLISVTCVLIFGEILPSAVMTGPAQLQIAAFLAPGVRVLMLATGIISWPMARLLDYVLGHSDGITRFKRNEFKALVRMQANVKNWKSRAIEHDQDGAAGGGPAAQAIAPPPILRVESGMGMRASRHAPVASSPSRSPEELRRQLSGVLEKTRAQRSAKSLLGHSGSSKKHSTAKAAEEHEDAAETTFSDDEVTILSSIFSLQEKQVSHLLEEGRNTWEHVRMLSVDDTMDMATMTQITHWGMSRIPIYSGERNNVVGLLLVKEHIALDPDDQVPIATLRLRLPVLVPPTTSIFDALNIFQTGHSHMALVSPHADTIAECWRTGRPVPPTCAILGLCTIEDVIEELIGEEVLDELDRPMTPGEMQVAAAARGQSEAAAASSFTSKDPLLPAASSV